MKGLQSMNTGKKVVFALLKKGTQWIILTSDYRSQCANIRMAYNGIDLKYKAVPLKIWT